MSGSDLSESWTLERKDKSLVLNLLWLPTVVTTLLVIACYFSVLSAFTLVFVIPFIVVITYVRAWNTTVTETLLVIKTVGIQVQQTNIFGKLKFAKHVPIENVKAVVINEIIRRQRVISYLAIILESSESTGKIVVPLLTETLQRLKPMEQIYLRVQELIFS